MPSWSWLWIAVAVPLMLPASASADLIKLKNGGEIRGELERKQRKAESTDPYTIRTLTGGVVAVEETEVQFCTRRPLVVEEYETRRRTTAETVESQWELAEWCRKQKLKKERETHLLAILDLDPEHLEAHRGLGHRQNNGKWISEDELMRSRGLVKYKGRYMLPQEQEMLEGNQATSAAEKVWYKKVNHWHSRLRQGNNVERREEATAELLKITDPHAAPALTKALRNDPNEEARILFVKIMAQMKGPKALEAIVLQSLLDISPRVRQLALESIEPNEREEALPYYIRELKHPQNDVVLRSAAALDAIGDGRAIPHLIEALVTTHRYKIEVREQTNQTTSFATNGSMVNTGQMVLPPEIEVMARTGQMPFGFVYIDSSQPPPSYQVRVVTVKQTHQNNDVLATLRKLTGENFGFDKRTWQLWWSSQKPGVGKTITPS